MATIGLRQLMTILAALLALTSSGPLLAQPIIIQRQSIDSTVAMFEQVFVGRIVEIGTPTTDGKSVAMQPVVFAVEEVLRGERTKRIALPDFTYPTATLTGWQSHSNRLLIAVNHGAPSVSAVIDLDADSLEVWSADFVLIKKAADVIQAAKDEIRRTPTDSPRSPNVQMRPPRGDLYLRLTIPADERLERRAHAILGGGDGWSREEAVEALKYFKSNENIRLLKSLLEDSDIKVGRKAYEVLTGWGVSPVNHPIKNLLCHRLPAPTAWVMDGGHLIGFSIHADPRRSRAICHPSLHLQLFFTFSAQKSQVKPQNYLTYSPATTSAWHFSYAQPAILDI
jgi:hypothetical protein